MLNSWTGPDEARYQLGQAVCGVLAVPMESWVDILETLKGDETLDARGASAEPSVRQPVDGQPIPHVKRQTIPHPLASGC